MPALPGQQCHKNHFSMDMYDFVFEFCIMICSFEQKDWKFP